jgi:N6-L-threonylcarbamoyladenine synthase
VSLPRPLLADPALDFSFSGLKTATVLAIEAAERTHGTPLPAPVVADLCASFQEAAVEVLVEKAQRALRRTGMKRLAVVGGLAANTRLRERVQEVAAARGLELRLPPPVLCTDNAAMIAAVADRRLAEGERASLGLDAFSRVPLPGLALAAAARH